jgi:hypothetical protein
LILDRKPRCLMRRYAKELEIEIQKEELFKKR